MLFKKIIVLQGEAVCPGLDSQVKWMSWVLSPGCLPSKHLTSNPGRMLKIEMLIEMNVNS